MTGGSPVQDPLRFGAEEEVRADQSLLAGQGVAPLADCFGVLGFSEPLPSAF